MLVALVLTMLVADVFAADNQIYITQTNATNSQIDIEQLGSGNLVADNASATGTVDAAMNINGTGLNFNLDQRGDANWFLTDLNGNGITVANSIWDQMKENDPKLDTSKPKHPITADSLKPIVQDNDIIITMGAGNIWREINNIHKAIN